MPLATNRIHFSKSEPAEIILRALQTSDRQREASAYMNFLIRPDAEQLLREDGYRRLLAFFTHWGTAPWLTEDVKARYRAKTWYRVVWTGPSGYVHDGPSTRTY